METIENRFIREAIHQSVKLKLGFRYGSWYVSQGVFVLGLYTKPHIRWSWGWDWRSY